MIYVLVSLPAYAQLRKIAPELVEESESKALQHIGKCADLLYQVDGKHLYAAGSIERQLRMLSRGIIDLESDLKERRNEIHGFSIGIVTSDDESDELVLRRLIRLSIKVPFENGVWTDRNSTELLDRYFEIERTGDDIAKISGYRETPPSAIDLRDELLVRSELVDKLHESLAGHYTAGRDGSAVFVVSSDLASIKASVFAFLEQLRLDEEELNWYTTRFLSHDRYGYTGIARSVAAIDKEDISRRLNSLERDTWERTYEVACTTESENRTADGLAVDLSLSLRLSLLGYVRKMKQMTAPPVWYIEGLDRCPEAAFELIEPILKELIVENGIFFIASVNRPVEMFSEGGIAKVTLTVSPLRKSEARRRLRIYTRNKSLDANDAERIVDEAEGSASRLYRLLLLNESTETGLSGSVAKTSRSSDDSSDGPVHGNARSPECPYLRGLPDSTMLLLTIIATTGHAMDRTLQKEFAERFGLLPRQFEQDLAYVADLGFVEDGRFPCLGEDCRDDIGVLAKARRDDDFDKTLIGFCNDMYRERRLTIHLELALLYAEIGNVRAVDVCIMLLRSALAVGDLDGVNGIIERVSDYAHGNDGVKLVLDSYRLRIALLEEDSETSDKLYSMISASVDSREPSLSDAEALLACADYLDESGMNERAMGWAKLVPATLSRTEKAFVGTSIEARASYSIGMQMLALSKLGEAQSYFDIAGEQAGRNEDFVTAVGAITYEAISHFLSGNISRAQRCVKQGKRLAIRAGMHEFHLYLCLIEIRIAFEIGEYERAETVCSEALRECELYGMEKPVATFEAWQCRALTHCRKWNGLDSRFSKIERTGEVGFFEAEASYIAGDYERARAILEEASSYALEKKPRTATIRINWDGGYSLVEGAALRTHEGRGTLSMQMRAFLAFLRCYGDTPAEPIIELTRITRDEKLSALDPYNGLYCYFLATGLSLASESDDLDRITALSRAAKYVEERAARIDDAATRRKFLSDNFWNKRIVEQARNDKLV